MTADVGGDPGARAVVLLHGGGQTRHAWGSTARALVAAGFYVVSLDLRGHGDSDWDAQGDYSLDLQVEDLRSVLRQIPGKPAIVGASLGGFLALLTIGETPEPIARQLVLVDVTPMVDPAGEQRIFAFMQGYPHGFASVDEAADAVAAYLPHRPRPASTAGLQRNLRLREDGRYYWHWDPRLFDKLHASPQLQLQRYETAARNVRVPTLLVRGQRSELVTPENVRHFLGLIPSAKYVDVAGAGHMVAGDRNDAFSAAVLSFLEHS
ncbi:alpha/beta fold hydrolase [Steroidobacter cummioxidans]|uniref:alpha/beta fold hydrolase n=1 Tax=Steroidobacter cummioxidans TaxID=1803913 RepID=UPI000E31953A|nr:alpha/beta hydrolase [Steroidobacter cummioxidans]